MNMRILGNSDMRITRVGFGAWAVGGDDWQFGWGPQGDADSIAAIHRALELGINWIDTAASYGLGHPCLCQGFLIEMFFQKHWW